MPKKKARTSPSNTSSRQEHPARVIKLRVTDKQLRDLRVAAAIQECRVTVFCRDAALEAAFKTIRQRYSS